MVKKRSVFDIDFDPEGEEGRFPAGNGSAPTVTTSAAQVDEPTKEGPVQSRRRGPMASAISETAQAVTSRTEAEEGIRAENDALAQEHVRLKKLGLITDLIETDRVKMTKLTRDRSAEADMDLEELMESIKAVGLSNPIRVEQMEDGYELIQGFRRLSAFRALQAQTGDPRYRRIPAALVLRGEPLASLYRKMVDENLIRKDLSFGEMARLALAYGAEAGIDVSDAVSVLYASALKQKRTYIRQFAKVLEALGEHVQFPEAIPRALGLDLYRFMELDVGAGELIISRLSKAVGRDVEDELRILRFCISEPRKKIGSKSAKSISKISLKLAHKGSEAKVTAEDGRLELRMKCDFSSVSKEDLHRAIEALLAELNA